jgi:hypothetical protein
MFSFLAYYLIFKIFSVPKYLRHILYIFKRHFYSYFILFLVFNFSFLAMANAPFWLVMRGQVTKIVGRGRRTEKLHLLKVLIIFCFKPRWFNIYAVHVYLCAGPTADPELSSPACCQCEKLREKMLLVR